MTYPYGNEEGKRTAAIIALLSEPTIEAAARKAGMSDTTLYRLLRDEAFAAEYRAARREAVTHAVARLQADSSTAVKALMEIITNPKAPAMARVKAIGLALEYSIRAIELDDLGARIERLERLARGESDEWEATNYDFGEHEAAD